MAKLTRRPRFAATAGFTLVEMMIVVAVIGVLAAISVPGVLRARMAGDEASAIATLRTIHSAQTAFASSCGAGGFAQRLSDLARPPAGDSQGFVGSDIAIDPSDKSGYRFSVEKESSAGTTDAMAPGAACNVNALPIVSAYWAGARPVSAASGERAFAIDSRGALYQDVTGVAIANPIPPGTVVIQ